MLSRWSQDGAVGETEGGIDSNSKITLRNDRCASATQIRDRMRFVCQGPEPDPLHNPSLVIHPLPLLPFSPQASRPVHLSMLAGPYTPTHASSRLFHDAMERRGRSRAIPTTAAIRKSRHHQRQLYYSHYPPNPRSPSLSPIRSPQ